MQFAEQEGHNHVHFHIVPRMSNLPDAYKGANIFQYLGVDEPDRVPEPTMNDIAAMLRGHIEGH